MSRIKAVILLLALGLALASCSSGGGPTAAQQAAVSGILNGTTTTTTGDGDSSASSPSTTTSAVTSTSRAKPTPVNPRGEPTPKVSNGSVPVYAPTSGKYAGPTTPTTTTTIYVNRVPDYTGHVLSQAESAAGSHVLGTCILMHSEDGLQPGEEYVTTQSPVAGTVEPAGYQPTMTFNYNIEITMSNEYETCPGPTPPPA